MVMSPPRSFLRSVGFQKHWPVQFQSDQFHPTEERSNMGPRNHASIKLRAQQLIVGGPGGGVGGGESTLERNNQAGGSLSM